MIDSEIEMKGLGRRHPTDTHNKRSLTQTSHVCHRRRAARRNQQVEEYKHKHIHNISIFIRTAKIVLCLLPVREEKNKQSPDQSPNTAVNLNHEKSSKSILL